MMLETVSWRLHHSDEPLNDIGPSVAALQARILQEWKDAAPGSPWPWIHQANQLEGNERLSALVGVQGRFPDHLDAASAVARALFGSGETAEALRVFEEFVAEHPTSGPAWAAWIGQLKAQGLEHRADEVAEQWLATLPDDPHAREALLWRLLSEARTPADRRAAIERAMTGVADRDLAPFCSSLGQIVPAEGLECLHRVAAASEPDEAERVQISILSLRLRAEGVDSVMPEIEELPENDRRRLTSAILKELVDAGRCHDAVRLVRRNPAQGLRSTRFPLRECLHLAELRALFVDAVLGDPGNALNLIRNWDEDLPHEIVREAVWAEVGRRPTRALFEILNELHEEENAGARLRVLDRWFDASAAGIGMPWRSRLELADMLAWRSQFARAREVLLSDEGGSRHLEATDRLMQFALMEGKIEEAEALIRERLGRQADSPLRDVRLAQIAAATARDEEARDLLRSAWQAASAHQIGAVAETYQWFLAANDEAEELARVLDAWYRADHSNQRRDLWLAERYAELGMESPVGTAEADTIPRTSKLEDLVTIATASTSDPSRMLLAAERMILLAENDRRGWLLKARALALKGEPSLAIAAIQEAIERLDYPPSELWILWSEIEFKQAAAATGDDAGALERALVQAIGTLNQRMERDPTPGWDDPIHQRLKSLYEQLATIGEP